MKNVKRSLVTVLALMVVLHTGSAMAGELFSDGFSGDAGNAPNASKWHMLNTPSTGNASDIQIYLDGSGGLRVDLINPYTNYLSHGVMTQSKYTLSDDNKTLVFDLAMTNTINSHSRPQMFVTASSYPISNGYLDRAWLRREAGFELACNQTFGSADDILYWNDNSGSGATGYDTDSKTYDAFHHYIITVDATNVNWYIEDTAYADTMTPIHTVATSECFTEAELAGGLYVFIGQYEFSNYGHVYTHDECFDGITISEIPEPATLCLLGIGGIGVLLRRRRS